MNRLDGKVALISGAARGIGAATAKLMADAGAAVVIGDLLADKAKETADEITANGGKAVFVPLDVTSEKDWRGAVATATKQFGKLDVLVNNAGLFLGRDFEDVTIDEWNKLVAVNLTGVWLGTKLCTAALKDAGATSPHGSAIVNLASVAGLVGSQLDPLYSMTKGGVTLFTKSTALSYGRKGYKIRVNSIHPGVIETPMVTDHPEAGAVLKVVAESAALRRIGQPDDVSSLVLFLASDDAARCTARDYYVDAGWFGT